MSDSFHGSLTEHAYCTIRDRILRGELSFGAGLSRRVLAEELQISIVPVGDALQRLESDGLVESRPRVGTRVRIPTEPGVRGHYIVREALETQAARIFAEKSSRDEREEILRLARELDALYIALPAGAKSRERLYEIHQRHMRFHMRIAECTGCEELCRAVEKNQVLVFNWLYDTTLGNAQPPAGWHAELARVLVSGNAAAADAAMRRHTRFRMEEVLEHMAPYFSATQPEAAAFGRGRRRRGIAPVLAGASL